MGEREELVAAIRARVDEVTASGNPAAVLSDAAQEEAYRLALLGWSGDPSERGEMCVLGWMYHYRSLAHPPALAAEERDAAASCFIPSYTVGDGGMPPSLLPFIAKEALPLATELLVRGSDTIADLTFVVSVLQRIAHDIPGNDPDVVHALVCLSAALMQRYTHTGQVADAHQAVEAARAAVRHTTDGEPRRMSLRALSEALLELSGHTEDPSHLDEAVEAGRAAARALAEGDPAGAAVLTNLGLALQSRFRRRGQLTDMHEAVDVGRAAVRAYPHDDPKRSSALSNLGLALQSRFDRTGRLEDLDEAVELSRAAVLAAPRHAQLLTALSYALNKRAERTGDRRDLDGALEASRAALEATPRDAPHFASRLAGLGEILRARFQYSGHLGDLDEATDMVRAAVRATPRDQPDYVSNLLNLAATLRARFRHTGALADGNEAVEAGRVAVEAAPQDHPERVRGLSDLALVLRIRFERTKDLRDADEAVETARAAVRATPDDHPDRVKHLSALGNALKFRFDHTAEPADGDEAVAVCRTAVRAMPPDHAGYASRLNSLGVALWLRFERNGDRGDLDEAVEALQTAVQAVPDGHPDEGACLPTLAVALRSRFESTGDPGDREEALTMWGRTVDVKSAPPWVRIRSAHAAGQLSAPSDPGRALGFLERAVRMLPEVAPRRLRRGDQQHALGNHTRGIATLATALALAGPGGTAQERAVRALGLAETARAVLLSQALDTRSDLTELHERHPRLAERFSALRQLLDGDPAAGASGASGASVDAGERAGRDRHRLATELEELLERIRACEGFAGFGLPPGPDELVAEAAEGPVVTFNVSDHRSDALLLTRHGISSCPLPGLTESSVVDRVNAFYRALRESTAPDSDRIAAQQELLRILEWLWEAAAEPVLDALAALGETIPPDQDGAPLPRVWWAPGGLLGLLPLHAAGFHTDPAGARRRTVLDRVVSSYTPTVRALRHARGRRHGQPGPSRSLIVAMPTTPGGKPLPHVPEEARRVRAHLHGSVQLTEPGPAPDGTPSAADTGTPTTAAVLALLPRCSIAHFACHGASDRDDPSRSRLLLHDDATTPLTVSALAHVNLDHAQLAYLSACDTANSGGFALRDEAIHLTSAFQLAGFPHVIGTLWPIVDRLAVDIAESFYTRLTDGQPGTPVPARSALALHHTIRAVRDRFPAAPSLWAAYLHAGA